MAAETGIEDLNLYAGPWCVRFADIARARGHQARTLEAVGFESRSVLPPFEDPVTIAVNAARPIVDDLGRDTFGTLIVATESSVDYGKPLSTYVHRHLRLPESCRNFEIKHACFAGTAALQMASAWVRSPNASGRRALVVMTDSARRHFADSAELTGGAGAVALAVSRDPRVLALDPESGSASREIYDVARPTPTAEWGDPVLSLHAYLDLLESSWEDYRRRTGSNQAVDLAFPFLVYHTPLLSLVEHAHAMLLEADDATPERANASFARQVLPCLGYNRVLGNVYSGCIFVALAGLIEHTSAPAERARVGFYSYGSGSCAEFFSGRLGADSGRIVRRHEIGEMLAARRVLSIKDYEAAMLSLEESLTRADFIPAAEVPAAYRERGLLVLDGVKDYRRQYREA
jgi:3-hydroxy-3-methylglutaryl CoA synthase